MRNKEFYGLSGVSAWPQAIFSSARIHIVSDDRRAHISMGGLRVLGVVPNRSEVLYGEARILAQPGAVVLWGIGNVNVFNALASADHTAASA